MTNESAATPSETMNPATPASVSVNPIPRPSSTSAANTSSPEKIRLTKMIEPSRR